MLTLPEFLLARFDEREALARGAIEGAGEPGPTAEPGPWTVGADVAPHLDPTTVFRPSTWTGKIVHACSTHYASEPLPIARHIAAWDPATVLADCAMKRRLVRYATTELHDLDCMVTGEWGVYSSSAKDDVLRALAAPFAGHPEFDPEWRLPHEHTPDCRDGDGPRCARCGMRCHDRADCPRSA